MSGKLKRKHGDLRSREKERQASGESRYIAVTLFLDSSYLHLSAREILSLSLLSACFCVP